MYIFFRFVTLFALYDKDLIWFILLKILLYFIYGLVHLATRGYGSSNPCAKTSEGAAGTIVTGVSSTVSPASKAFCEGDIVRLWSSESSVEAFDLMRISFWSTSLRYKHSALFHSRQRTASYNVDLCKNSCVPSY